MDWALSYPVRAQQMAKVIESSLNAQSFLSPLRGAGILVFVCILSALAWTLRICLTSVSSEPECGFLRWLDFDGLHLIFNVKKSNTNLKQ